MRARDAEIGDHRPPALLVDEDVVGLDVAMDDPVRVREGERVGHLAQHAAHEGYRRTRLAAQALRQALAVDEAHDEEHQPVALVHRVDGDDVGMAELGRRLRFAQEARADLLAIGELRRQHLEGDAAAQAHVHGPVHDGRAAAADLGLDVVGVADGGDDPVVQQVRHRPPGQWQRCGGHGSTPGAPASGAGIAALGRILCQYQTIHVAGQRHGALGEQRDLGRCLVAGLHTAEVAVARSAAPARSSPGAPPRARRAVPRRPRCADRASVARDAARGPRWRRDRADSLAPPARRSPARWSPASCRPARAAPPPGSARWCAPPRAGRSRSGSRPPGARDRALDSDCTTRTIWSCSVCARRTAQATLVVELRSHLAGSTPGLTARSARAAPRRRTARSRPGRPGGRDRRRRVRRRSGRGGRAPAPAPARACSGRTAPSRRRSSPRPRRTSCGRAAGGTRRASRSRRTRAWRNDTP